MPDPSRHARNLAAWNSLKGATWPLFARLGDRVGEADPTPAQMGVLHTLWSAEEWMTPHVLSECLHVTGATVTGNLNALEAAGLIKRTRNTEDERQVLIALTSQGQALREKARSVPPAILAASTCSIAELSAMKGNLIALRDSLNAALGE